MSPWFLLSFIISFIPEEKTELSVLGVPEVSRTGAVKKKAAVANGSVSPSTSSGRHVTFPLKDVVAADDDEELDKCFMKVTGMTCSSCVANIERNLIKMEGTIDYPLEGSVFSPLMLSEVYVVTLLLARDQ